MWYMAVCFRLEKKRMLSCLTVLMKVFGENLTFDRYSVNRSWCDLPFGCLLLLHDQSIVGTFGLVFCKRIVRCKSRIGQGRYANVSHTQCVHFLTGCWRYQLVLVSQKLPAFREDPRKGFGFDCLVWRVRGGD